MKSTSGGGGALAKAQQISGTKLPGWGERGGSSPFVGLKFGGRSSKAGFVDSTQGAKK